MRSSDWSSDVCSSDLACVVGAMALFGGRPGSAAEFHCNACDVKASEVERCQRMDPADYVTGLLFNPSGMKTYFKRSSCLQAIAVDYRDASLCEDVRERKSLFFDGSAISRASCERRVEERARSDPTVIISDIHRLADVPYFRNGNGRDIAVRVGFSGCYRPQYDLTGSMVEEAGPKLQHTERPRERERVGK